MHRTQRSHPQMCKGAEMHKIFRCVGNSRNAQLNDKRLFLPVYPVPFHGRLYYCPPLFTPCPRKRTLQPQPHLWPQDVQRQSKSQSLCEEPLPAFSLPQEQHVLNKLSLELRSWSEEDRNSEPQRT